MERKNTILLTVIAIATLLVAVVGATFAYFTATFTPKQASNNAVSATAKTFVNTSFDYGSAITPAQDIVPGYKTLKVMTVEGSGEEGAQAAKIRLTITPTIPEAMKGDIKYTLYEETGISTTKNAVTCTASSVTPTIVSGETRYADSMTCTPTSTANAVTSHENVTLVNGTASTLDITVEYNTKKTYYLVVEYVNNTEKTQDAQGQTYSVTLKAEPITQ